MGVWSRHRKDLASLQTIVRKINIIDTLSDEAKLLNHITQSRAPVVVSFVNQNALNIAWRSPVFASCLIKSDVLLLDGIGMAVCLFVLRGVAGRNMNGTDFIPRLAAAFAGRPTALFGTVDPWTSQAAVALERLGCRVVSLMDGFKPDEEYVTETILKAPDLIILAMGNPRQEILSAKIASAITKPTVIVNGGAIADFLAHRFERAPLWVQRAHFEWMFRLLLEPGRLWRRYTVGGFAFVWSVLRLRMML
jgi:exopolysaccharide biosynthesis WecB/TagA/CpsF family protein